MIQIKGCFKGIHTTKVSILQCFHWFPDMEMAIVLYIDDAISTDKLNMSCEPGTGEKKMKQMVSIFWAEPEWIITPNDDTATSAIALKTSNLLLVKFVHLNPLFFV